MTLAELKKKLADSNIPDRWYALEETSKPDAFILYKSYANWEFFYLDAQEEKHNHVFFATEEDAYDYLWHQLQRKMNDLQIK